MKKSVTEKTRQRSKELRKNLTPSEKRFWFHVRGNKVLGFHFRRQHPIGPYIADFCLEKIKLVIEIDGETHDFRYEKDVIKDQYLKEQGYEVIRIPSKDVMNKLDDVIEMIFRICEEKQK